MAMLTVILLTMITTGTKAELGQECKYVKTVETDKWGRTNSEQRYECKTAPREVVTKTEVIKVQSCLKLVLFGVECDPWEPEGAEVAKGLQMIFSLGIIQ